MNESRVNAALLELAHAARDLARVCDREAAEYGPTWHRIASNAEALRGELSRDDLEDLLRSVAILFSYRPGSFTEVYIRRANHDEQLAENAEFDRLKERVMRAAAEVGAAAKEGELNTGAVRRHLTSLETVFLEAGLAVEAKIIRAVLNADALDVSAVRALLDDFAKRSWPGDVRHRVDAILDELRREFALVRDPSMRLMTSGKNVP